MAKKLIVNPAWCKGCGICITFCPKEHLEMVHGTVHEKENPACVLCGLCELHCPDYAIYIEEREAQ